VERADKIFSSLPDDQLLKEVAPGRNRLIYLWGHLTAVHDAMFPILGLGERLHPELDAIFVSSPDKTGAQLPPVGELRKYWDEVNGKLLSQFATLAARRMVAAALRNVRGRLCQRSDPEPTGCSPESNQPHVLALGADNFGYQITFRFFI
jgi:hypothetical protein